MKEKLSSYTKADCLVIFAKSFLTAYALCAVFHAPLSLSDFETAIDYCIASIYELLGSYDLKFLLLLILSAFFYGVCKKRLERTGEKRNSSVILSGFYALCLLLGGSYHEIGSSAYCFGSVVNLIKSTLAFVGYTVFFRVMIGLVYETLDSHDFLGGEEHFFTRHAFRKSFSILFGLYMFFLLFAFPGNLCWDAIGQIEQVIGSTGFSTHHPLFHTLIMGGLVKAGQVFFHSPELGLFCYMLLQDAVMAAAMAATIAVLSGRGAKFPLPFCLLLIYCITPVYSNMASTAVKDVPYAAFTVGYIICLALLLENPDRIKNRRFVVLFFVVQIFVILLRNNGMYVILLSGIGCLPFLLKRYNGREKILCLFSAFGGSVLTAGLILFLLASACNADSGSIGEMMSVPFQQTARYLQLYQDEISPSEREAIEAVLGDVSTVADRYDPASADPVKALFSKNATGKELAAYMKAWGEGFLKHPGSYFETFFLHIYGWFTPSVSNSIRYEADEYGEIRQGGLFPNAEKLLIFYYRFAGRTLLGFLENTGISVWALFFLVFYQKRHGQTADLRACIPLWISLLICMAAPCFFGHPRYAFPILFSMPFMYGFTLTHAPLSEEPAQK